MNKGLKVFIIVVVAFVALILVRDQIIKGAVTAVAKQVAGVDVTIGGLSLSLINQSIHIKDLKVYNPEGFPTHVVMVDVPDIQVKIDVPAYFKSTIHVPYMRLDLKEAHVIRNKDKALNVNSLKFSKKTDSDNFAPPGNVSNIKADQGVPKEMKMQLDLVTLNIGTIYMDDYSSGKDQPRRNVFQLNIKDAQFKNITSAQQLASVVMVQALLPTGLDGLFSGTSKGVNGAVDAISGLFKGFKKKKH